MSKGLTEPVTRRNAKQYTTRLAEGPAPGMIPLAFAAISLLIVSASWASTTPKAKTAFDAKMRAIGTQAQRALFALPPATGSQTKSEQASTAGQLQTIYARIATRMAALTVPKE